MTDDWIDWMTDDRMTGDWVTGLTALLDWPNGLTALLIQFLEKNIQFSVF